MCNWTRSSVAYTGMHRVPLLLFFSLAALAQPSRQDPLDTAIQAVWKVSSPLLRHSMASSPRPTLRSRQTRFCTCTTASGFTRRLVLDTSSALK